MLAAVLLAWTAVAAPAVPLPPPLETGHLLGKGLAAGVPPVALDDQFYALGWSRNNAFASLVRRTLPDGSREVRFEIDNLVEDKVLLRSVWPDWGEPQAQESWWADRQSEVEAAFSRWSLQSVDFQLGEFPVILDNEFLTLVLRTETDPRDARVIDRLQVVAHSTGRGLKVVSGTPGAWRWAALLGFIPSPFENRVALVLAVQPVGWLGDRQPLRFLVSGLSLKAGFPKP